MPNHSAPGERQRVLLPADIDFPLPNALETYTEHLFGSQIQKFNTGEIPYACVMAYDPHVADRVWKLLSGLENVTERKMFGGIAFMLNGNMCCGVVDDRVVLRLGNDAAAKALGEPHIEPMDFTGRPIRSMVYLETAGHRRNADLRKWVDRAVQFTRTLPGK